VTARALRAPALDATAVAVPPSIAEALAGQVVVITPLEGTPDVAPKDGALVFVGETTGQAFVVQRVYSDLDTRHMQRQMLNIFEERKTA
jgi:hypothetical protein